MLFMQQAQELESFLRETRRDFHRHPELPGQEKRTSEKVRQFLEENGIETLELGLPVSVAALIRGARAGKTAALRTELDALPIQEQCPLDFASENPGVMHACGHDVHLSCLLGAAKLLKAHADEIHGNVLLIFQSAEETSAGAKEMIAAGLLEEKIDAIFGLHTNTELDAGDVAFMSGPSQASADMFRIDILGRGGHGAFPHTTLDPIVTACQLTVQLQTIVSRSLDPMQAGVVSVCRIDAGTSSNIIPERAQLYGTIRALEPSARELLIRRIEDICQGISLASGCDCRFTLDEGAPAVVNDCALTELARSACANVLGAGHVKLLPAAMVGDDMAEFLCRVPGVLGALGVRNEKLGAVHGNHTPHFMVDESCLVTGAACMAQMAWDFLSLD